MTLRLLAVHAHPDDESSKGAATYAAYADRGVSVLIVSCTGGEAGDILNPGLESIWHARRDLAGLRRVEMAQAQQVLGVQHRWLGYVDSGMAREDGSLEPGTFAAIPIETSVRPLIRLVREFRPHVLVTYDENGGYPHPDHIRSHEISMRAWRESGTDAYPELGPPWRILKLYYDRTMNAGRAVSMFELLKRADAGEHLVERMAQVLEWMGRKPTTVTTHVEVADYFEQRDAALLSHASQVSRDDFFFFYPRELERDAYPYEDYQLIDTRVKAPTPESDLFAGIEDAAAAEAAVDTAAQIEAAGTQA